MERTAGRGGWGGSGRRLGELGLGLGVRGPAAGRTSEEEAGVQTGPSEPEATQDLGLRAGQGVAPPEMSCLHGIPGIHLGEESGHAFSSKSKLSASLRPHSPVLERISFSLNRMNSVGDHAVSSRSVVGAAVQDGNKGSLGRPSLTGRSDRDTGYSRPGRSGTATRRSPGLWGPSETCGSLWLRGLETSRLSWVLQRGWELAGREEGEGTQNARGHGRARQHSPKLITGQTRSRRQQSENRNWGHSRTPLHTHGLGGSEVGRCQEVVRM